MVQRTEVQGMQQLATGQVSRPAQVVRRAVLRFRDSTVNHY